MIFLPKYLVKSKKSTNFVPRNNKHNDKLYEEVDLSSAGRMAYAIMLRQ